jgi:hypothetical protein
MISMDRWDVTTYLPLPPLSMTRDTDPGPRTSMPGGSSQWKSIARFEPWEAAILGAWREGM